MHHIGFAEAEPELDMAAPRRKSTTPKAAAPAVLLAGVSVSQIETPETPESSAMAQAGQVTKDHPMADAFESVTAPTTEAFKAGYEKLTAGMAGAAEHSKANMEAMAASAKIAAEGVKEATELSLAYAKTAGASFVETAKSLGGVKSLQEAVELQADFARSTMTTYFAEFTKISDVLLGAMKESAKPLSERASAMMSAAQAAR